MGSRVGPDGDEHPLAGEVAARAPGARSQRLDDGVGLGEPAPAREAGGERARVGLEHRDARAPRSVATLAVTAA